MGVKKSLNSKRLTKKQVQELIKSEGRLHQEFTGILEETYLTGSKNQPQIYELSNDRFLLVFDPNGISIPGRGDIYSKEYFLRLVKWTQKIRTDSIDGRGSSLEHWRYYSQHKGQIIDITGELIDRLATSLDISRDLLNLSSKSLDILSIKAEDYGLEKVQSELYDNLVAYVGEVMRYKVKGDWMLKQDYPNCEYPAISINDKVLMPINTVWQELQGLEQMNLRKGFSSEIRRFVLRYRDN